VQVPLQVVVQAVVVGEMGMVQVVPVVQEPMNFITKNDIIIF
jgi:hypothetical protein